MVSSLIFPLLVKYRGLAMIMTLVQIWTTNKAVTKKTQSNNFLLVTIFLVLHTKLEY